MEGALGREGSVLGQVAGTGLEGGLISHEVLNSMLGMEGPLTLDKPQSVGQLVLGGQGIGLHLP